MGYKSRRRKSARADALFPFVGVLFSAIGALSLIWAASSLESVAEDETLPDRIKALEEEVAELEEETAESLAIYEDLKVQIAQTQLRLDQMQTQIDEATRQRLELERQLAILRERIQSLREKLAEIEELQAELLALQNKIEQFGEHKTLAEQVLELRKQLTLKQEELLALQAEEQQILAQLDDLQKLVAQLKAEKKKLEEIQSPRVTLRVQDGKPKDYQWYDVSTKGFANVNAASAQQESSAFFAEGGAFDQLIAHVAEKRTGHPILLIRPGAMASYHRFAQALRERRVPYAAEPINADWDLSEALRSEVGE